MTIKAWLREEEDDHILVYDVISDEEDMMSESADRDKDRDENDDENESDVCDDIVYLDDSSDGNSELPLWVKLPSETTKSTDWQMDISFEGNLEVTSFMVHQSRLGPQSEYFNVLFRENGFSESHTKKSAIQFPASIPVDLECDHFEKFLDFFYLDVSPRWDENEVLSLLYLADYFEVKNLRERYMDIIQYNLVFNQSHAWIASAYQLADVLSKGDIKCTVAWLCRCNHDYFCGIWDFLQTQELKRKLVRHICKLRNVDPYNSTEEFDANEDHSGRWHKLVLHVLHTSPEIIDADLFSRLTYEDLLWSYPDSWVWMGADEAIKYLKHEQQLSQYLKHEQRLSLDKPDEEELTRLQEVCIRSLFANVSKTCKAKDVMETLSKLKPAISRSLLFRFIENEEREYPDF